MSWAFNQDPDVHDAIKDLSCACHLMPSSSDCPQRRMLLSLLVICIINEKYIMIMMIMIEFKLDLGTSKLIHHACACKVTLVPVYAVQSKRQRDGQLEGLLRAQPPRVKIL